MLAQTESIKVKVPKGNYIKYKEKVILAYSDTTVILPKDCNYTIFKDDITGHKFYDSLYKKANKLGKIPGEIVEMFLVKQDSMQQLNDAYRSSLKFSDFDGYKIRDILFEQLDVFGQSVFDTASHTDNKVVDFLNNMHMQTRIKTIKKHLTIKAGEEVVPLKLSESERILRKLTYLRNARIILIPVSSKEKLVDVLVITQDLFPYDVGGDFKNFSNWNLSLWNINIGGFGNEGTATLSANSDREPFLMIKKANYSVNNIGGSFVDLDVDYQRDDDGDFSTAVVADRDFYTYSTKYAGGTHANYVEQSNFLNDTSQIPDVQKLLNYGAWIGRSFSQKNNRSKAFVFSTLFDGTHYFERPFVSIDSNKQYYKSQQFLLSATYSYNRYYNARWVNRFGITEDIPYGFNATVTFGPDMYEFYNRFYTGIEVSQAFKYPDFGYVYNYIGVGGFFHKDFFEQAVLDINSIYFSETHDFLKSKTRHHISLSYTLGYNRFYGETVSIADMMNMEGATSADNIALSGTQRSALEWIAMSYTPITIIGFDIAAFASATVGTIGQNDQLFWENSVYTGVSLGLQTRNENLIFKTLMLRLSYFPVLPNDMANFQISFKGVSLFTFKDFKASSPAKVVFE